jgi:hypothetical protein
MARPVNEDIMRYLFVAVLVAVPSVLITWIVSRGVYGDVAERCAAVKGAAPPSTPAASPAASADPDQRLKAILADALPGFSVNGTVELYDAKGLFDYIDGAAPLYIDRKFRKLAAAEMKLDGGGELTADVYDMSDAEHARSIYEAEATPTAEAVAIGDGGRKSTMAMVFRKGAFYVKLTAFDAKAEAALPALAEALVARMP